MYGICGETLRLNKTYASAKHATAPEAYRFRQARDYVAGKLIVCLGYSDSKMELDAEVRIPAQILRLI